MGTRKAWADGELAVLLDEWGYSTKEEISMLIDRTPSAIKRKAQNLHLKGEVRDDLLKLIPCVCPRCGTEFDKAHDVVVFNYTGELPAKKFCVDCIIWKDENETQHGFKYATMDCY